MPATMRVSFVRVTLASSHVPMFVERTLGWEVAGELTSIVVALIALAALSK
jgi:hypothetical protein